MQERIVNVRDGIYDAWKNATPRNVACKTTQFLAEAYLQHKLATALTEFFSNAEQYADQLRRGISSLEKEEYFAQTPEGTKVSVKGQYVEAADEAAIEAETQLHRRAHKNAHFSSSGEVREIVLPTEKSYENARNKAFELIGDVDWHNGKNYIGNVGIGKNRVVGRMWCNGKVVIRLDWDYMKGPHINLEDWRLGKGVNGSQIAIPFRGDYSTVESLLKLLQR